MGEPGFRAGPVYLVPVAVDLLVGLLFASLISGSQAQLAYITVFPEAGPGPLLNAALFVALVGVGGLVIYLLLRRGLVSLIRLVVAGALATAVFSLSFLYSEMVLAALGVADPGLWALVSAASSAALFNLGVFRGRGSLQGGLILALGGALGTFLGASIPTWSGVALLLLLALYDVVAVYRGHLGRIASRELDCLRGIILSFREVQMGLGDLTFYSMLTAMVLLKLGPMECAASAAGILLGVHIELRRLERESTIPGLPLALSFGLAGAGLALFLKILVFHGLS